MSTATAIEASAPAKGTKKLILIVLVAVLALATVGAAAVVMMKKSASADYADDGEDTPTTHAAARPGAKATPIFVPLEPFTVNLADRNADRYAQVGITLEVDGTQTGEQIKAFMPAIRNNILMTIADRTAADLLGRDGKTLLAERVKRETSRALGYDVAEEDAIADAEDKPAVKAKKGRKSAALVLPVKAVHFSNFIIQ